jgi:hypothetical protein
MRTTLDVDDDVLQAASERADREGRTIGKVLSELARRGLTANSGVAGGAMRHGVPVLPSRGAVVTLEHVQRISDGEGV